MKVNKDGQVKLERGETRYGNFFVKRESGHIKVQDISSLVVFRLNKRTAVGMWLSAMLEKGKEAEETVKVYAATMFSTLLMVPDDESISALLAASNASIGRHPEFYGAKAPVADEEDAQIVEAEREKAEFVEQIKNLGEDGGHQEG